MTDQAVPTRTETLTVKVKTPFGSMYVHVQFDERGIPCGGSLSDPQKEPDAQVAKMVKALSEGLDEALRQTAAGVKLPY